MKIDSKKLGRAIVGTLSYEVRTALVSIDDFLGRTKKGYCITEGDLVIMKNSNDRIKNTLAQLVQLANSDLIMSK